MIKLCKAIIGYCCAMLCKRGELRDKDVLLAPKLSSSIRISKFLSSRVLLLKFRLKSYSDLFRVSMDPRVNPEGDGRESVPEGDGRESVSEGDGRESVSEGDNSLLSSFRRGKRGQAIFELGKNLTPLNLLLVKRRVAGGVFLLFLLFPSISYSAVYFLPDVQTEEKNILSKAPVASIDTIHCEDIGYTYYSSGKCPEYHNQDTCVFMDKYLKCDATEWCLDNGYTITSCSTPKYLDSQCPNNLSLYKSCVCPTTYKYACTGTGYSSGNGTVCDGKYTKCNCATNYVWSGSACVCDSAFKYTCSGTGYSSGSGVSCGGKYKSCNCSSYYSWNGSSCVHYHSYSCVSGYTTSCSNGYYATSAKSCVCGGTSGTCYACCSTSYQYYCSGIGYSGGSGSSCNGKYTTCSCASGYIWNGSACVRNCPVGYFYYTNGSCGTSNNGSVAGIVIQANTLVVGVVVYTGSWYEAPNLCYYHNPGIGYGQWFVPTSGDLYNYVHFNYSFLSAWLPEGEYWGSTEHTSDMGLGRIIGGNYAGYTYAVSKNNILYIACVLSI